VNGSLAFQAARSLSSISGVREKSHRGRDFPTAHRTLGLRRFDSYRETLGGDEGHLRSSRGDLHFVSVVKWAGEDPDKTFVKPVFTFVPDDERKAEWMDLWKEHFERFPFESGG
jgi:hypothetical protein